MPEFVWIIDKKEGKQKYHPYSIRKSRKDARDKVKEWNIFWSSPSPLRFDLAERHRTHPTKYRVSKYMRIVK